MTYRYKLPRCCGAVMVSAYIRHGKRSITPGSEKVGLYCPRCRRFKVKEPEQTGLEAAIKKYPTLEHVDAVLKPYMHAVKGLYLHGSRVKGDYREDSDYDLVLISRDKIPDLKTELKKYNVQLECFTLKQAKKQLELEPAYLLTVLRQGFPLIGADLQKQLLRREVNDIALLAEIDECKKRIKELKKVVREYKAPGPDDVGKARIFLYTMRRLRRAYYIKQLYMQHLRPLAEDFKRYYKGDFEQIHKLYRIVRDLPLDADVNKKDLNETEIVVPDEIKKMTKSMFKELLGSVDAYIKNADEKLVEIYLETHPE